MGSQSLVDTMFQMMKDMEKPTPPLNRAPMPQWMSSMYLRMIDTRADHLRQENHNQNVARNLTKAARKSLTVDKHRREDSLSE